MFGTSPRSVLRTALPALLVLGVAACGGGSGGGGSSTTAGTTASVGVDPAVAAKVPAAVKQKGTLVVAADATYPPNEFIGPDGKTVVGMDADLAKALAKVMGLKVEVKNATFDGIIPGLASGRYDLGMSSFTDTKERQKTVDFVTYLTAGTAFFTKANGGTTVNGLADLCGKTVAVEKGTTQQNDATAQSKKCGGAGVKVLTFPDQNGANLALASGRAQIGMADSPVADYQVKKSNGQFKIVGRTYGTAPYGVAIPKSEHLAPAIQAAMEQLMRSGEYKAILDRWGVESGAITKPVINGAVA